MSRVTSLTNIPDAQLNRWIKRVALLVVVVLVAFVAFYVVDRFRAPAPSLVDRNIATLEEAVRTDPKDIVARGKLADMYFAAERYEDAVGQYSAIIDSGKEIELASLGRAQSYQELGRYDEAKVDYAAVVEIAKDGEMANVDPNLQAAYFGLGAIALAQGKPKDAVEPLESAVAIIRTDADALTALGTAYNQLNESDKALEVLRRAAALVPVGWADPYQEMAKAYTAKGDAGYASWATAMGLLAAGDDIGAEAALKTITGDAEIDAWIGLAYVAETRGDNATASDWYNKVLDKEPENESALLGLARVREITAPSNHPALPSQGAEESN